MKVLTLLALLLVSTDVFSIETTEESKVIFTQGHFVPSCRVVRVQEISSGQILSFRIADDEGSNDIQSILLTALTADKNVQISYDPAETTGCGTEPKIRIVTIRP